MLLKRRLPMNSVIFNLGMLHEVHLFNSRAFMSISCLLVSCFRDHGAVYGMFLSCVSTPRSRIKFSS